MYFKLAILIAIIALPSLSTAQEVIQLYDFGGTPNHRKSTVIEQLETGGDGISRISSVTEPTLTAYFPPEGVKNTGTAVIICPGGGYRILAISHEGYDVAQLMAANGITAFVLKYRLPSDETMEDKRVGPLQDAQRAIQLVRENAKKWSIDDQKIGIAGFSAGGHLASTLSTHYQEAWIENPKNTSLRPDFSLLLYPVISMGEGLVHGGSRTNLLGEKPSEENVRFFSNELQVTSDTPPAFLVHAEDDKSVPIGNSQNYVRALERHQVKAKLLTYPRGGHGFGLNNSTTTDKWFDHFLGWLYDDK